MVEKRTVADQCDGGLSSTLESDDELLHPGQHDVEGLDRDTASVEFAVRMPPRCWKVVEPEARKFRKQEVGRAPLVAGALQPLAMQRLAATIGSFGAPDWGDSCGNTSKEGSDVDFLFSMLPVISARLNLVRYRIHLWATSPVSRHIEGRRWSKGCLK